MGSHTLFSSCFLCEELMAPTSLLRHISRAHARKASGEFIVKLCALCLKQNCEGDCNERENRRSNNIYVELAFKAAEQVMGVCLSEKDIKREKEKPNLLVVSGKYKAVCKSKTDIEAFKELMQKSSGFKYIAF